MFFGNFAEKGREEVEIKDVVHEEILDLLHLIYLGDMEITNRNVQHILKLADQFQMTEVMEQAEKFLILSKDFKNKLVMADQYRLVRLKDDCLKSYVNIQKLHELCKSPEYAQFSDAIKVAISDRFSDI